MPIGELSEPVGPLGGYDYDVTVVAACLDCRHPVDFHDIEEGDFDGGHCQWPDCECKAFR